MLQLSLGNLYSNIVRYEDSHPYNLLPFRFIDFEGDEVLIVNDIGEYLFIPKIELSRLIKYELDYQDPLYRKLRSKHFLYDRATKSLLDTYIVRYRTKKSFLEGFTSLHIVVPTLRCNHSCPYCQVSRVTQDKIRYDMNEKTAEKVVDFILTCPSETPTLEVQGGEPLLNYPVVRYLIEYAAQRGVDLHKDINFVVATNLSQITDDMLTFFKDYNVSISTSLDGPEFIHNQNRPNERNDSYDVFMYNLERVRNALGIHKVSALMTTTRLSLDYPHEIVDEYVKNDFKSIFLRPLNPFGFATKLKEKLRYSSEEFLQFYHQAFDYILDLNLSGIDIIESYANIILTKILTPFSTRYVDLQSPAGAGNSVVLYNYNGDVYPGDEARMLAETGDFTFRMGNVLNNSYEEIFASDVMKNLMAASCAESLPGCSDCAFLPYCGADPINNYATQGNIYGQRPTSDRCKKQLDITKYLFTKLQSNDERIIKIFIAWITEKSVREVGILSEETE